MIAKQDAFTLIEVLIATLLVGLAVVALLFSNSVFTQNNASAMDMSTAEFLIEQIRELTTPLSVAAVAGYDEQTFNPPIDAGGQTHNEFSSYTQKITAKKVNPSNFTLDGTPSSPFLRVTVDIYHNGRIISSSSWIRAQY